MKILNVFLVITMAFSAMPAIGKTLHSTPVNNTSATGLSENATDGYYVVKFKKKAVHQSIVDAKKASVGSSVEAQSYGHGVIASLNAEHKRTLALGADLLKVNLQGKSADHMLIELMNSGQFEYVEKLQIYRPFEFDETEYNDHYYNSQRYFGNWSPELRQGSGFAQMRSSTVNNLGRKVRVAVIDTGSYRHEDIDFVGGYDFVTYEGVDDDGNIIETERDPDPTDEYFNEETGETCNNGHGLAVSSMIAAKANNGTGMVGAVDADMVEIVPVRALGCYGGSNTDIMEGVLWAAGESIEGVPDIEEPVDIVNMSLGGFTNGGCPKWEQDVFDRLHELGVTVVVAAGNENTNVVDVIPASCTRIITVAATDERGDKAEFSNYGEKVDISTFGTNIVGAFLSTTEDDQYSIGGGTSYSAPLVAATAASLRLKYPSLTPEQIESIIKSSAADNSEFDGAETVCGRRGCGTGILQADIVIDAINNASQVTSYHVAHRYEGYDSEGDETWIDEMSAYVNTCQLVKYQWGNLGTEVDGVSYKLFLSQNGGEKTELETITIPQKVIELPKNSILSVQACVDGNCGEMLDMPADNLAYPAVCESSAE